MTETPRPPGLPLTLERLEEMQRHFDRTLGLGISELRQLFQHIDALEAALQAARAERDNAVGLQRNYRAALERIAAALQLGIEYSTDPDAAVEKIAALQEARAERDKVNSLYQTTLVLLEAVTREKTEPRR